VKKWFSSSAIVGLLAAGPLVTGCADRTDTPDYQEQVTDSLKTAKIENIRADWKKDEQALHLTGEAESTADKARAEELAKQVVGTSGRVVNEVKVEGTNAEAADDRIEDQLDRMFKEDGEWDMDGLDLNFDAKAGVVTITGQSPSEAIKLRITERVRKVNGVTDVVNNLEVRPDRK
jgi:osmotically-inducible protein OsmY